jgi:hypothetical protein
LFFHPPRKVHLEVETTNYKGAFRVRVKGYR